MRWCHSSLRVLSIGCMLFLSCVCEHAYRIERGRWELYAVMCRLKSSWLLCLCLRGCLDGRSGATGVVSGIATLNVTELQSLRSFRPNSHAHSDSLARTNKQSKQTWRQCTRSWEKDGFGLLLLVKQHANSNGRWLPGTHATLPQKRDKTSQFEMKYIYTHRPNLYRNIIYNNNNDDDAAAADAIHLTYLLQVGQLLLYSNHLNIQLGSKKCPQLSFIKTSILFN